MDGDSTSKRCVMKRITMSSFCLHLESTSIDMIRTRRLAVDQRRHNGARSRQRLATAAAQRAPSKEASCGASVGRSCIAASLRPVRVSVRLGISMERRLD
jgi:hypothetical protein